MEALRVGGEMAAPSLLAPTQAAVQNKNPGSILHISTCQLLVTEGAGVGSELKRGDQYGRRDGLGG